MHVIYMRIYIIDMPSNILFSVLIGVYQHIYFISYLFTTVVQAS